MELALIHVTKGIMLYELRYGPYSELFSEKGSTFRTNSGCIDNRALGSAHRCKSKYLLAHENAKPRDKYLSTRYGARGQRLIVGAVCSHRLLAFRRLTHR